MTLQFECLWLKVLCISYILQISDFGLSKWKDYSRSHTSAGMTLGTPSHISPEQWKDIRCPPNDETDVYSFGILLWEMFTEEGAYEGRGGKPVEYYILHLLTLS